MSNIHFINSNGEPTPLPENALRFLLEYSLTRDDEIFDRACESAPAATVKQLAAAGSMIPQIPGLGSDYEYAQESKLVLLIDREGGIRYKQKSLWHPRFYHFVNAGTDDGDDDWMLLEGACEIPSPIRFPSLAAAHALVKWCERQLSDYSWHQRELGGDSSPSRAAIPYSETPPLADPDDKVHATDG